MSRIICCLGVLSLMCLAQHSTATDLCCDPVGRELKCTYSAAVPFCCPDCYCKPSPCIPCIALPTTCDCYCRKPMPCIPCFCLPRSADNYCRKPMPCFFWPVNCQFYRCPPGNDPGEFSGCK